MRKLITVLFVCAYLVVVFVIGEAARERGRAWRARVLAAEKAREATTERERQERTRQLFHQALRGESPVSLDR